MTVQYTVFDTSTGEILRTGECMTVAQAQLQGSTPGTSVLTVGSDPTSQVVQDPGGFPGIVNKPPSPMSADKTSIHADGVEQLTISSVPIGSVARFTVPDNQGFAAVPDQTVNDGSLAVTTTVIGTYVIRVQAFPNTDFMVTFNAV